VLEKAILNEFHEEAQKATGAMEQSEADKAKGKRKGTADEVEKARQWMCKNFFDVRTFGAVMSTGINCGQVTGPIQFNFGKSIEPIVPIECSITRMAVATEEESKKQKGDNRTMGRKQFVPYGLYRAEGYISANFAQKTGFNEDDLELFWEALENMFEHDHSAARGKMCARKLIVFKHDGPLGNAPAHKLFELITVPRSNNTSKPARAFSDYDIVVNKSGLPKGVTLEEKI
jgi:CRISPR-associated protein Csd2